MVEAPPNERVFVCPVPYEHPPHKRNPDGSVLHRWSGMVSVCYKYGVVHLCTASMCSHQVAIDGEISCQLTGRVLGSEIAAVTELPFSFDSGSKVMTAVHTQSTDVDAIERRMEQYNESRPEHAKERAAVQCAAKDAAALERLGTKRAIDTSGYQPALDGSRTAGPTGLLEAPPEARKLTIMERVSAAPRELAEPMVVRAPPNATPRAVNGSHPFSVIGDGPTDVDIRHHFVTIVDQMWTHLEEAYSLRLRAEELREAERNVIARCIDRRRLSRDGSAASSSSSSSAAMQFNDIAAIHRQEVATALEGMHYVYILANWPAWTSGRLRAECTKQLVERMWKLWEVITRSPKYHQCQKSQLFKRVGGAMLTMVIDGYKMAVCEIMRDNRPVYVQPCAHQKDAVSVSACGHSGKKLALISPYELVQQLLAPDGMNRRVLNRVCGFVHGHRNSVVSFLTSLIENGLTAPQIRKIHIGHEKTSGQ